MKKFKNFKIVAHWHGYVERICSKRLSFTGRITTVPLDKKVDRARRKLPDYYERYNEDGSVEMKMEEIPKKDQHKVELGKIFDWYIGYTLKPYQKRREPKSLVVFMKKYGNNGKRINMKKVKEMAEDLMRNLQWD